MEQTEYATRRLPAQATPTVVAEPTEPTESTEPKGPLAAFVRFVVCGGGVGVVSSGAVALLAVLVPWVVANALVTVVSTVVATELHARFTFGAGRRAGRREHLQSAGSAAVAYGVTCAAMAVLHLVHSAPGVLVEQTVYLSASALAGVGRFLVLRLFVFATNRPAEEPGDGRTAQPAPVPTAPRRAPLGTTSRRARRHVRPLAPTLSYTWHEWTRPGTVPAECATWTTGGSWTLCLAR